MAEVESEEEFISDESPELAISEKLSRYSTENKEKKLSYTEQRKHKNSWFGGSNKNPRP